MYGRAREYVSQLFKPRSVSASHIGALSLTAFYLSPSIERDYFSGTHISLSYAIVVLHYAFLHCWRAADELHAKQRERQRRCNRDMKDAKRPA